MTEYGADNLPDEHELDRMSTAELGARLDGVEVVDEQVDAPEGSEAYRRAHRRIVA